MEPFALTPFRRQAIGVVLDLRVQRGGGADLAQLGAGVGVGSHRGQPQVVAWHVGEVAVSARSQRSASLLRAIELAVHQRKRRLERR
jgi:hypothetical protein